MIIKKHDAEANVLTRRLELLNIIDDMVRAGIELEDLDDNPAFNRLQREFAQVLEPSDLISSIKAIYARKH